jgi:hypothetical protein
MGMVFGEKTITARSLLGCAFVYAERMMGVAPTMMRRLISGRCSSGGPRLCRGTMRRSRPDPQLFDVRRPEGWDVGCAHAFSPSWNDWKR